MKHIVKIMLVAMVVNFAMPLKASAANFIKSENSNNKQFIGLRPDILFGNACLKEGFIDVRGNADIDGAIDGIKDGMVTIAEVAVVNPLGNLGELVGAVLAADPAVLAAIADPDLSLTVFAPVDEAFMNIPGGILTGIIDDGALTSVLLYHVVAGEFDPRQKRVFLRRIQSLLGQDLFVAQSLGNPTVNQSEVQCTGVKTDNGLVWLIDSVFIPQF